MLKDVLDDIEQYLEQREDADGVPSGGGYRPNEEMSLLMRLREARARAARADRGMSQALNEGDGSYKP